MIVMGEVAEGGQAGTSEDSFVSWCRNEDP